ncbi:exodeoxyribonuclease VII large subunit [Swingsia samuiensis]|uniref:Exodeoxyribonuclease 7 large subunit n=1 Tax=Swingsia samuiensis TaxID=1293412 RepID=A0A4Y6UNS3_9PROT|nr:exodeoxyribonuclease VII large subunit [Swingsia samuiensis]QDH18046.1 exodeoxyribonuclease VII large subunit [Swingsia samuiensis]
MMEREDVSIRANVPQYSVSEISGAIKRTLESGFGRVRVRGEITELKKYPSGHVYLSLKDEGGKISGVIWRGSVSRLGMVPENGNEVIATGKVSSYGERSSYQLIIDRMEFAGEGALLAKIEQLRRKLLEEGLFAPELKKPIPFLPSLVGVITSRAGAVLHDIQTTIARRFPRNVLLWPVAVQGEGAAAQIVAAIEGITRVKPQPDVIIVARGGGSLEDLMAFNDERVIRAVAQCPIPIISAVGHETDTTLIDLVSDRRAPTPTAAAEMAVPLRSELVADLAHRNARLAGGLSRVVQVAKGRLEQAGAGLPDLPSLLETARMRLDDRSQRLELALPSFVLRMRNQLEAPNKRLPVFDLILSRRQHHLNTLSVAFDTSWQRLFQKYSLIVERQRLSPDVLKSAIYLQKVRVEGVSKHLEAVSPLAILSRGYVLVQDSKGQPMTSSHAQPVNGRVILSFSDGKRGAKLDNVTHQEDLGL